MNHLERGTVAAVTSARKIKYSGQKKNGMSIMQSKPGCALPKKQTIAMGKEYLGGR